MSAAATSGACTSRVSIVGAANIDTRGCRTITSRIAAISKCGSTIWCAPFRRNGNAYSPAPCDTGGKHVGIALVELIDIGVVALAHEDEVAVGQHRPFRTSGRPRCVE